MAWYSTGTIQVAANGTVATGTGTQFLGNVRIGDGITIAGSTAMHEVAGVTSDTQLTFAPPYAGSAGAGKAYRIAPVLGYDKDLSDAFNALRLAFGDDLAALKPWATAATADAALSGLEFSATGKAIARAASQVAGRDALGLGSAAARDATTSLLDATPGRMMSVGAGGWLAASNPQVAGLDADAVTVTGLQATPGAWTGSPHTGANGLNQGVLRHTANFQLTSYGLQEWYSLQAAGAPDFRFRNKVAGVWGGWNTVYHSGNSFALPISGSLAPATDNAVSYGTAARRPSQFFAATNTISTSDATEKSAIRELSNAEYAAGLQLAREIGAYQWLEAIERKGESARWHIGQTVQRAMAIFEQHGLDPFAYGAICYDSWDQETVEHPAEYEQIEVRDPETDEVTGYEQGALIKEAWTEVTQAAGDRYSWRDNELLWLMVAAQQRQQDELTAQQTDLAQRLAALERADA